MVRVYAAVELRLEVVELFGEEIFLDGVWVPSLVWVLFVHLAAFYHLFSVHYLQWKVDYGDAWMFAPLWFFLLIFCVHFSLLYQFEVLEFNLPRHYGLNQVILLIPCEEWLLKGDWHAIIIRLLCRSRSIVHAEERIAIIVEGKWLALRLIALVQPGPMLDFLKVMDTLILVKVLVILPEYL